MHSRPFKLLVSSNNESKASQAIVIEKQKHSPLDNKKIILVILKKHQATSATQIDISQSRYQLCIEVN